MTAARARARARALGPAQRQALEVLAAAPGGLTIAGVAARLDVPRKSVDTAVRHLERHGRARIAGHEKRAGRAAAVYVASTTGLAALEVARRAAS